MCTERWLETQSDNFKKPWHSGGGNHFWSQRIETVEMSLCRKSKPLVYLHEFTLPTMQTPLAVLFSGLLCFQGHC